MLSSERLCFDKKRVSCRLVSLAAMVDYMDRSTKINLLKEGVVKKLCEVLDKSTDRGWRKLGEIVGKEKRLKVRWV